MSCVVLVPWPSGSPEDSLAYPCIRQLSLAHSPIWLYGPGLSKVRDGGVQMFLDTEGADVALFIDSDVTFTPSDAEAVVSRARYMRGVAGAAFASSLPGAQWNVFPKGFFESQELLIETYKTGDPEALAVGVDGLGCGLMAIHRDVFTKILDHFPELKMVGKSRSGSWFRIPLFETPRGNVELSEDLAFCWRAAKSGSTVELVQAAAAGHRNIERRAVPIGVKMTGLGLGRLLG